MSDDGQYYLSANNEVFGPFSRQEMVDMLARGEIGQTYLCCLESDRKWGPVSSFFQVASVSENPQSVSLNKRTIKIPPPGTQSGE